jgi:hypothetical protein
MSIRQTELSGCMLGPRVKPKASAISQLGVIPQVILRVYSPCRTQLLLRRLLAWGVLCTDIARAGRV